MYTAQEKAEIERVLKAFENYIADAKNAYGHPDFEVVDKAEYRRVYDSITEQQLNQITEEIQQWIQPYIQALPEYAAYMQEVVQEQLKDLKKR